MGLCFQALKHAIQGFCSPRSPSHTQFTNSQRPGAPCTGTDIRTRSGPAKADLRPFRFARTQHLFITFSRSWTWQVHLGQTEFTPHFSHFSPRSRVTDCDAFFRARCPLCRSFVSALLGSTLFHLLERGVCRRRDVGRRTPKSVPAHDIPFDIKRGSETI